MKQPNFFILGAPKCGTTSLVAWLNQHPQIFLSEPKEPNFFAPDIAPPNYTSVDSYEKIFKSADPVRHRAVGEASTVYLRSALAVPSIIDYQPSAKLIVMLRSPVEMAISWHGEMLFGLSENLETFEEAWLAQDMRSHGKGVPRSCLAPGFLQYSEVCALGSQLEKIFNLVDKNRIQVILLDDLVKTPSKVYQQVTEFLEVDPYPLATFETSNARKTHRCRWFSIMLKYMWMFRMKMGIPPTGLLSGFTEWTKKSVARPEIRDEFRQELLAHFEPEVRKLERLLDRDLADWVC